MQLDIVTSTVLELGMWRAGPGVLYTRVSQNDRTQHTCQHHPTLMEERGKINSIEQTKDYLSDAENQCGGGAPNMIAVEIADPPLRSGVNSSCLGREQTVLQPSVPPLEVQVSRFM